jgi:SAM-dependent methyltransferase
MTQQTKESVRSYWDTTPCGAQDVRRLEPGSRAYFDAIEATRFEVDDFMPTVVDFAAHTGKRVLEVGCGLGTDLRQFAKHGAIVTGIDLSKTSVELARKGFELYGLDGTLVHGDGEELPFPDRSFDLVYSWGVIHHSPDPPSVVRQIHRVLKPGGELIAMVYNRRSLLALQAWAYFGLLQKKPFTPIPELLAKHVESPGTKAYTIDEARELFSPFTRVRVDPIVTLFDLRVGKRKFLPKWTRNVIPSRFGWFLVVRGTKAA